LQPGAAFGYLNKTKVPNAVGAPTIDMKFAQHVTLGGDVGNASISTFWCPDYVKDFEVSTLGQVIQPLVTYL
jgi:hypothetical protein